MPSKQHPEHQKILRVGWVGTGPFSFYGGYISVINNTFHDYNPLNMRVTHIWGDDYSKNYKGSPEFAKKWLDFWTSDKHSPEGLAKMYNVPNVCEDFHEMVDKVDAAMIMDFDRSYELSEPFLKKGLPIFLCSPVAVNVRECERILNLAEASNAAVYTGSFTANLPENDIRYTNSRRKDIAAFFASTSMKSPNPLTWSIVTSKFPQSKYLRVLITVTLRINPIFLKILSTTSGFLTKVSYSSVFLSQPFLPKCKNE